MSLTIAQKTNANGFPKSGELIEITGAGALEAADRILLNSLYQIAHESGQMTTPNARWSVPISTLKSTHVGNERLRESLSRLLKVEVNVSYQDDHGTDMILQTHLFEFFASPKGNNGPQGNELKFGFPEMLREILARSGHWGRIRAEVVCAMTSKFAIALYELVQLRTGLKHKAFVDIPIDRFRDLLGVPEGKLLRGPDFRRFCLEPAVLEVNGLSDYGVKVELKRAHARAPVSEVRITWWEKKGDEFRAAHRERQMSKVGRLARLKGQTENVFEN
jgi:hypothetical protein